MATCMYCGGQISDHSKFCELCGAALPVEAVIDQPDFDTPSETGSATNDVQPGQADWQATSAQPQPPYGQAPAQAQQPYDQAYQQPAGQQYQQPYGQPQPAYMMPAQPAMSDSGSIGWGVLGFFFPIVGLILFLVWRSTKPKCSQVAGIGALVGFLLNLVFLFAI